MTEDQVMEEQVEFKSGSGCEEHIIMMRELAKNTIEKDRKICIFVDLVKAYNKVYAGRSYGKLCRVTVCWVTY